MVAGVFRNHGVFAGKCLGVTPKIPTGAVENIGLKAILKNDYPLGLDTIKLFREGFRAKIEAILEDEGYVDGPWMAKHAAVYWKVWDEFNPKFVCIKRDYHSVIRSNTESGMAGIKGQALVDAYNLNIEQMEEVRRLYDAVTVDANEVVMGDYSSLENAFEFCGLEFDEGKANEIVNPKHWHYG